MESESSSLFSVSLLPSHSPAPCQLRLPIVFLLLRFFFISFPRPLFSRSLASLYASFADPLSPLILLPDSVHNFTNSMSSRGETAPDEFFKFQLFSRVQPSSWLNIAFKGLSGLCKLFNEIYRLIWQTRMLKFWSRFFFLEDSNF